MHSQVMLGGDYWSNTSRLSVIKLKIKSIILSGVDPQVYVAGIGTP